MLGLRDSFEPIYSRGSAHKSRIPDTFLLNIESVTFDRKGDSLCLIHDGKPPVERVFDLLLAQRTL